MTTPTRTAADAFRDMNNTDETKEPEKFVQYWREWQELTKQEKEGNNG